MEIKPKLPSVKNGNEDVQEGLDTAGEPCAQESGPCLKYSLTVGLKQEVTETPVENQRVGHFNASKTSNPNTEHQGVEITDLRRGVEVVDKHVG